MAKVEIFSDRHKLCVKSPRKNGPPKIDVYKDRRGGWTWPSAHNPGYYAIFGLRDEELLDGSSPLVLLAERTFEERERFFVAMVAAAKRLSCDWFFGDMTDDFKTLQFELAKHIKYKNIKGLRFYDASEFTGFEEARPHMKADYPIVPAGSVLRQQMAIMTPESFNVVDRVQPWQRFYAVAALNHVITSYVMYPYKERSKVIKNYAGSREGYA